MVPIVGDIVLDVVKAAAPEVAQQARKFLQTASGKTTELAAASSDFAEKLSSIEGATSRLGDVERGLVDLRARLAAANETVKADIPEAYQKFEAMVLGTFVQSMLPQDSEEVFGQGTAGGIWKGMMADKIGSVIAEGGGIGIAQRMADQASRNAVPAGQISEAAVNEAASLVNEIQMAILDDISRVGNREDRTGNASA